MLLVAVLHASADDTCLDIPALQRVDCGWPTIDKATCTKRGCCFHDEGYDISPDCFYNTPSLPIDTVHVVQACHFDAGFAKTIDGIVKYVNLIFPHACNG